MTTEQFRLAERVEWTAVRQYLVSRGWKSLASRRDDIAIFRKDKAEVLLPVDRELVDYAESVATIAVRVAELERRSAESVMNDLLHPQLDRVRAGRTDEGSEDGTLGFEESMQLIAGLRRALLAAACSEERPGERFHSRMNLKKSQEFIDRCRLGQTQRGSFVVSVLCPIELERTDSDYFGRRTVRRLFQSIGTATRLLRTDGVDAIAAVAEERPIITANICDAIIEMAPSKGDGDLWLDASWSPLVAEPDLNATRIRIDRDMLHAFADLAHILRPALEPRPDHFVGRVVELSGEDNDEGLLEGDVQFLFPVGEELVRARASLSSQDYMVALDAHRKQQFVSVRGVLRGQGKRATLDQVAEMRIVV